MCCKTLYSNAQKNICSKIVGGISLLLFILGIVNIAFSVGARNQEKLPGKENPFGSKSETADAFAGPVMVVGIFFVVVSILGCALAKFKNPMAAIPFGCMALILAIICIPVGLLSLAGGNFASAAITKGFKEACKNPNTQILAQVSDMMCTTQCPCDLSVRDNWGLFQLESRLNEYGRTQKARATSAQKKKGIKGMTFVKKGGLKTVQECVFKNSNKSKDKTKALAQEEALKPWKYMEKKYDCSGICNPPLFFITKQYDEQPIATCQDSIMAMTAGPLKQVGYVAFITGIVSLFAFIGSFPLCTGYNDKEVSPGTTKQGE